MKGVTQRKGSDCGVGAVATLAGVSYEEAFEVVYPDGVVKVTSSGKLIAALEKLGRPASAKRMSSIGRTTLASLPSDALLKVRVSGSSSIHWVVWDKKRKLKLDPWGEPMRHKVLCYLLVP